MRRHRTLLTVLAIAIVAISGCATKAAPPTVEIVSLSHWPVQSALKPIRDMLASYGTRIRVVELNAEEAKGQERLASAGLKGHIPLVIFIDGSYRTKRSDGTVVEFVSFPAAARNPMGLNGAWTAEDLEAAIKERLK